MAILVRPTAKAVTQMYKGRTDAAFLLSVERMLAFRYGECALKGYFSDRMVLAGWDNAWRCNFDYGDVGYERF